MYLSSLKFLIFVCIITIAAGWSTRSEHKGDGKPFPFQPKKNLIEGWSIGVLQMREGERANIHVPSALGIKGSLFES